jgi:uncharacterized protein (TIGR02145 family)
MNLIFTITQILFLFFSNDANKQFPFKTINIAGKIWTAENFKGGINSGACYEHNTSNCMNMGRLYSFDEAIKSAPSGWHLPTKSEWDALLNEIRKQGKNPFDVLNEGEFNSKFAGYKDEYGDFTKINYQARFWSATGWETGKAWYMYLNKSRQMADVDTDDTRCLFSVRYVKDEPKKTSE